MFGSSLINVREGTASAAAKGARVYGALTPKATAPSRARIYEMRLKKQILLWAIVCVASTCSPARSQTPTTFFGMNTGRLSATQPWPTVPLGTIRLWDTGTTWTDLEPSRNAYDWSKIDPYLSLAQAHNADVLYTFGVTPQWAASGSGPQCDYTPSGCHPPANLQDWDQFVTALVAHSAGRIKYWELWNEANRPASWSGSMSTLVVLAEHAYRIIKAADPNALVLTPSSTNGGALVQAFLTAYFAAGGASFTDVVSFHGYVGAIPEGILDLEAKVRATMSANGLAAVPIWDTEGGWGLNTNLVSSSEAPGYLARKFLLQGSSGVSRVYWYAWNNSLWGTLWTANGIEPSGVAYGQVYRWMQGATMNNSCSMAADSTWSCTLTRPGGYQALAIWNAATTKSYTPANAYKSYLDLAGNTHSIGGGSVSIGHAPILLVPATLPSSPTNLGAVVR